MNKTNKDHAKNSGPKIIEREKKMVNAMVLIYCIDHHSYCNAPCTKCYSFGEYSKKRLEMCHYREKKPVCGRCGLICYNPYYKNYAEKCFNYAGPRMMFQHPKLGLQHLFDSFRNNKQLRNNNAKKR
jgi:hypothetical protein